MQVDSAAALAWLAAHAGDREAAARALPLSCSSAGSAARITTTRSGACAGRRAVFAAQGDARAGPRLRRGASRDRGPPGHPDALAALAHALGETALAEGDAGRRRRAARARAGAPATPRHPLRARADHSSAPASPSRPPASASWRSSASPRPTGVAPARRRARWPRRPPRSRRASASRVERAARAPRRRRARRRRAVAARARGHAPARRRAHEPRDRARALPQPAHGRRARAQHPVQLGCRSRVEAASRARELGLLVSPPERPRTPGGPPPEVRPARPLGAPAVNCGRAGARAHRAQAGAEAAPMPPRTPTTSAGPRDPSVSSTGMPRCGRRHWKISVVQSPPWRRTSWARAGPSGRSWRSTKKSRVDLHAAVGGAVDAQQPRAQPGVELVVPGRVERVGDVEPAAVERELEHLRAAVQLAAGVGRPAEHAAEPELAGQLAGGPGRRCRTGAGRRAASWRSTGSGRPSRRRGR